MKKIIIVCFMNVMASAVYIFNLALSDLVEIPKI